jgi:hypothetical protein
MPKQPRNPNDWPPELKQAVGIEIVTRQRLAAASARRDRRIDWLEASTAQHRERIEADFRREAAAAEGMRARFPRKLCKP